MSDDPYLRGLAHGLALSISIAEKLEVVMKRADHIAEHVRKEIERAHGNSIDPDTVKGAIEGYLKENGLTFVRKVDFD
jgi:hypothetical protein